MKKPQDMTAEEICTRTTPQIDALLKSTLRDAYAELAKKNPHEAG